MFDPFLSRFRVPEGVLQRPGDARPIRPDLRCEGWDELMRRFGGATFEGGLYRLHDARSGAWADERVRGRFSAAAERLYPFGWDWLGRQLALDAKRRTPSGEPMVQIVDLVTGHRYEVDASFRDFHNVELLEWTNSALDSDLFASFAASNPSAIPLAWDQIVGYKIPLQLGGRHEVDNMEVVDMDVELNLTGQIRDQLEGSQDGTSVHGVTLRTA